ncbi:hypothetical protein FQZ97_971400 [compost metagenome]
MHGFVKAFNAVLPARFQFAAQGPQLVLQLRPTQGILLEQAGDLCLLARLVAGPCRLDLLFEGEQAVGYQHLQVGRYSRPLVLQHGGDQAIDYRHAIYPPGVSQRYTDELAQAIGLLRVDLQHGERRAVELLEDLLQRAPRLDQASE